MESKSRIINRRWISCGASDELIQVGTRQSVDHEEDRKDG